MISFAKCWTGRRWVNIGHWWLAIGFGPRYFVERVHFRNKLVWYSRRATNEARRKAARSGAEDS